MKKVNIRMKCKNCGEEIRYDPAITVPMYSDWRHVRTRKRKCELEYDTEYAEPDPKESE